MYWSARTYTKHSLRVALPTAGDYVAAAAQLEQPAIAITDKANLTSVPELYRAGKKHGVQAIPGIEFTVSFNALNMKAGGGTLTMLATDLTGYRNLAYLTWVAWRDNRYGVLDLADLAGASERGRLDGVACLTGPIHGGLIHAVLQRSESPKAALNVLKSVDGWFGSGAWVELTPQGEYTPEQMRQVFTLTESIAESVGLPTVITTGARYVTDKDKYAWSALNEINQGTGEYVETLFAGHLTSGKEIQQIFTEDQWDNGITGLTELRKTANVSIPELDAFSIKVPDVSTPRDPDQDLVDRTTAELHRRQETGLIPDDAIYWTRWNEEMEVIVDAGFSGYLLFTATVTDWIRSKGIAYNARGSASASLLCWLLDITALDPVKWKLPFDRFLSRDRTKPPDVDIDVDSERRGEIVDWLAQSFPSLRIGTWAKGSMTVTKSKPPTGSLPVQYRAMLRRTKQNVDVDITEEEIGRLTTLAEHDPYLSLGVGAAGILVAPDEATIMSVPVYRIDSSDTLVASWDKETVESMGYVKLDVLGVSTLTALRMIADTTGVDWATLDFDDKQVYEFLCKGDTGGLFQLEGYSFTKGIKQLKPKTFNDIVAAMALFRPATMKSGGTESYMNRRFRKEKTPKRHELLDKHLADTYGVLLYQEQAIAILRELGLSQEDIEEARKAIKASNAAVADAHERMKRIMGKVREAGTAAGMGLEDLTWLDTVLHAYAEYGFNIAHAVSYARVAYITAWYKVHYPLQFWTAFLTIQTGTDNEKAYLKEIRESGITVRGPHINKSKSAYTVDADGVSIRKSLTSIKGVGEPTAREIVRHAPYASLDDIVERVSAKAVTGSAQLAKKHQPRSCGGAIAALAGAGALTDVNWRSDT